MILVRSSISISNHISDPPVNLGVVLGCQDFIVLKRWPPGCQEWEALQNHNTQPLHHYKIRTMTHTKSLKSCKIRMHKTLLDMVFLHKMPSTKSQPNIVNFHHF